MSKARAAMQSLFNLGKPIKSRSGWIWELNDSDQILKVTQDPNPFFIKNFNKILSYLQTKDSPAVVKIYKYGIVSTNNSLPFHYHIMQKLKPLQKLYLAEDLFTEAVLLYYFTRSRKAVPFFLSDNMVTFISDLKKIKYKYYDLHCDNIMQDQDGKFKVIDLESFL